MICYFWAATVSAFGSIFSGSRGTAASRLARPPVGLGRAAGCYEARRIWEGLVRFFSLLAAGGRGLSWSYGAPTGLIFFWRGKTQGLAPGWVALPLLGRGAAMGEV